MTDFNAQPVNEKRKTLLRRLGTGAGIGAGVGALGLGGYGIAKQIQKARAASTKRFNRLRRRNRMGTAGIIAAGIGAGGIGILEALDARNVRGAYSGARRYTSSGAGSTARRAARGSYTPPRGGFGYTPPPPPKSSYTPPKTGYTPPRSGYSPPPPGGASQESARRAQERQRREQQWRQQQEEFWQDFFRNSGGGGTSRPGGISAGKAQAAEFFGFRGKVPTNDEVNKRARQLALKHHPDRGGDVEKMKEVNKYLDMWKTGAVKFAAFADEYTDILRRHVA